ncbi:MAG: hypothetical protein M0P74_13365 [Syntrophales bacterium]|nr:hypothetical protein [Syntrophales bacterium]
MHDRNHLELVETVSKQNAKRKCSRKTATDIEFDKRIKLGINYNAVEGILHSSKETSAEIPLPSLVISSRFDHLGFSVSLKYNSPHVSDA